MTPEQRAILKRMLKIAVAAAMLAALYRAADWRAVGGVLASLDENYLAAGLALFVPQTFVLAARWRRLVAPLAAISLAEAVRQTLAASALNLVLPSKLGDFSKAAMLQGEENGTPGALARMRLISKDGRRRSALQLGRLAQPVLEKAADVAALTTLWGAAAAGAGGVAICAALIAISAAASWPRCRASGGYWLASYSLVLWSLHLLQIDCFLKAGGVFVPWAVASSRVPAAIFAGLLPISFCGIGTRDSALVWLFSDLAPAPAMAAVGALTALRYLLPGAVGIPFALSRAKSSDPAAASRSTNSCEAARRHLRDAHEAT